MSGPQEPRVDDDTGWADDHGQLWDVKNVQPNSLASWKINSTGVNIARQLASAHNRGLAAGVREHGPVEHWLLPHSPAVLWLSESPYAARLGCTWIASALDLNRAATLAREHAAEGLGHDLDSLVMAPVRVWRGDGPHDEPGPSWAGESTGSDVADADEQDRSSKAARENAIEADAARPPNARWTG